MSAFELFHSYRNGWRDGAKRGWPDPKFFKHETRPDIASEYQRGFDEGTEAERAAMRRTAKRLKYVPNILRDAKP